MSIRILHGDCREVLATLPAGSVQCCVTSPPYFGLRDYGVAGQIGLEPTPDAYVAEMVAVFREVMRVLVDDGVMWLNLGDSYAANGTSGLHVKGAASTLGGGANASHGAQKKTTPAGLKPKDLLMIPARVAMALQADGWWLRSDCIWAKPSPMPESVTDRPTSAHEHVFLLTKRERYFYDADAVAEDALQPIGRPKLTGQHKADANGFTTNGHGNSNLGTNQGAATRNLRNVWTIASQPFDGAHFATMPPDLAERCIKAGSKIGDTILDPFGGAGTTGLVADRLRRNAVLIELNPEYTTIIRDRVTADAGMFAEIA